MKRLTDTDKWNKFLAGLPMEYKLLWLFITDMCSNAGIWTVQKSIAEAYVGAELDLEKALVLFGHRIHVFEEGRKWWIVGFVEFQEKGKLNSNHNRQAGIIKELLKYDLLKLIQLSVSKSANKADAYTISDHIQVSDTYAHTYSDTYEDTISVPVKVKESETVEEKEPDEIPHTPASNGKKEYVFALNDTTVERLHQLSEWRPEFGEVKHGEPVEEYVWLTGQVLNKQYGNMINGKLFMEALKLALKNTQDDSWVQSKGGLLWILDIKPGHYNGEKAHTNIVKYMNTTNAGPPGKQSVQSSEEMPIDATL